MTHPFTIKIMEEQDHAWTECEGKAEENLLRLSLLRELSFRLHAEQSRLLAAGKKDDARTLKNDENHIDQLRLQNGQEISSQMKKVFPKEFLKLIPPEKLVRQDRHWECAMAAEALQIGWNFWTLTTTIRVYDLEPWHHAFQNGLWPHGVVLWAENAEEAPIKNSKMNSKANSKTKTKKAPLPSPLTETIREPTWRGNWTLIIRPEIKKADQLKIPFEKLPGAVPDAPFEWALEYKQKTKR